MVLPSMILSNDSTAVDLDGYEKYFIFMTNAKPVKGLDNPWTADRFQSQSPQRSHP
jgi:hypothetical protein